MKNALLVLLFLGVVLSCGRSNQGELVGVKTKKFFPALLPEPEANTTILCVLLFIVLRR